MKNNVISLLFLAFMATGPPLAAFAQNFPNIEVSEVEIYGVLVFDQGDIEPLIQIDVGGPVNHSQIVQTSEAIEELYRSYGFEEVSIRAELKQRRGQAGTLVNVLQIIISEGNPTRIAAIRLMPLSLGTPELKSLWATYEPVLRSRLELKPGDPLARERVNDAKASIESGLTGVEFMGAQVGEVRVIQSPTPDERSLNSLNTLRWAVLEFPIDLGERVSFGFRGNETTTQSDLLSLINEQRVVGFGKDYVSSVRGRILEEYRSRGFAFARVDAYPMDRPGQQERHVTFVINEGTRTKLEEVSFDGNFMFTDDMLEKFFFDRSGRLLKRKIYIEKEVEKSAERLIDWMKSNGYLASKLVAISRDGNTEKSGIKLKIYLYEGEQTRIRSLTLDGIEQFSREVVIKALGNTEGEPLNLYIFNQGLDTLKRMYRTKGYLAAVITTEDTAELVTYSHKNRYADIVVRVNEGKLHRVGRISVVGLDKTNEKVLRRELEFEDGGVLDEVSRIQSEKNIRRLGIFSEVAIQYRDDEEKPGFEHVRVLAKEGTPGIVAGGAGVRNDLGPRLFGELGYTNLWHRNHTVFLKGNINRRLQDYCRDRMVDLQGKTESICFVEYQFRMGYVWPWFYDLRKVTYRPQITTEKKRFYRFDATRTSLSNSFERPIIDRPNLVGSLTHSFELVNQFAVDTNPDSDLVPQEMRIGSISPSVRVDLRDNPLAPTSGFLGTAMIEFAAPPLLSQSDPYPINYWRWQLRADGFVPLSKRMTWYLSFRTGFARNNVNVSDVEESQRIYVGVPPIKQFSLGGVGSLRGFELGEVSPGEIIQGTLFFVNYRTQIDVPLTTSLRLGPFIDAGNLHVDHYPLGILLYGVGVGLHYQTAVGPVNFDWGFKLNPQPGSKTSNAFHFSVGVL